MALRRTLKYGDVVSTDYGAYVIGQDVDGTPEKEYEAVVIPGRSGDLHIDKNRYKNITIAYTLVILQDAEERFRGMMNAMLAQGGNQRIEDTINPDSYRLGTLRGSVNPSKSFKRDLFKYELEFDCAPQRWLKEGEREIACSGTMNIYNPTPFRAKPLIKVGASGTGTISINGLIVEVTHNPGDMVIDCELEDAYGSNSQQSYNSKIALNTQYFPWLDPGENTVVTSGISCTLIPRWWML